MAVRLKGLSQLDYLWVNFGEHEVLKVGTEKEIPSLKLVEKMIKESSSSPDLENYYTKDEVDLKLALIDTSEGNLKEVKELLKMNTETLLMLNGPVEREGSILNIVTKTIQSAFDWENIN